MALQLTGTWEQALLAATAQTATGVGAGGYLGRTALQKILYFLQISGVPMRYKFDLYHYGPFCDMIPRDVEWLLADGVLEDISSAPRKYSNYRTTAEAAELLAPHNQGLEQHQGTIDSVVGALLPLQPDHLEMLATLHYLYRQLRAGGGDGPWKNRVVERFMLVKKDKFKIHDVLSSYDTLLQARLVQA